MIDERLLEKLACPACDDRPPVELKNGKIFCRKCRRAYPIEESWPVMLPEAAEIIPEEK